MSDEDQRTQFVESLPCPSCGLLNASSNLFCTACGSRIANPDPEPVAPSASAAPSESSNTQPMADRRTSGRVSSPPEWDDACVTHILSADRRTTHSFRDRFVIGREAGDLRVSDDPYLSGEHVAIRRVGARYVLSDLDSSNGTFLRIQDEVELRPGDEILIGGQVFRFLV